MLLVLILLQETSLWQERHIAVLVDLGLPSSLLSNPNYCQTGDVAFGSVMRSEQDMIRTAV